MKFNIIAAIMLFGVVSFMSCDDTTDSIGSSLTDIVDKLDVEADTFTIQSRAIEAGPVIARNIMGYLGRVKDPETGCIINGDFMMQFNVLEGFAMPDIDSIMSRKDGQIIADSCEIRLYYSTFYGDSLSQMKLTAYEMGTPMKEGVAYLSNFDPLKENLVRTDGIRQNRSYTLTDLSESDSVRNNSDYTPNICIKLNGEYTDKDGVKYNNYGTYLMRKYYENPENFRDSYKFVHNVIPGFFVKMTNGLGSMAYIDATQLHIYFRCMSNDSIIKASTSFTGTEEVLQTTTITNDTERLKELAKETNCTYLKTPAGLFTELTIPVEELMFGQENDTINSAKTIISRINNTVDSEYSLDIPKYTLMLPSDSLTTFFANNRLADNKTSFISTYSSTTNAYSFGNISNLINHMYRMKKNGKASENWNKVVLVPVDMQTSSSSSTTAITKISHNMSMSSTRLVGGPDNPYSPLTISVIYSKFNGR